MSRGIVEKGKPLFYPEDVGENFFPLAQVSDENVVSPLPILSHTPPPIPRIFKTLICPFGWSRRTHGGGRIQMRIHFFQLCVVMRVRILIVPCPIVARWIIRVIHAGSQILVRKIFVLMIEAEGMPDFLARYHVSPSRFVVS